MYANFCQPIIESSLKSKISNVLKTIYLDYLRSKIDKYIDQISRPLCKNLSGSSWIKRSGQN